MPQATLCGTVNVDLDRMTAGLLRRGVAALVDCLILFLLTTPFLLPWIGTLLTVVMAGDTESSLESFFTSDLTWWRYAGLLAVSAAYSILMLGRYGRTIGMMKLGLHVTGRGGRTISFGDATLRTAAYVLPPLAAQLAYGRNELAYTLMCAVPTIGLLWIIVDRAHQGYHDKIAGTMVVHERYYADLRTRSAAELS